MTKQAKKGFIKNFIQEYVPGTDKINCGNVLIFNKCKVKILNTWFYNVDLCLSSNELVEYVIINYKDEINKKEISIEIKWHIHKNNRNERINSFWKYSSCFY